MSTLANIAHTLCFGAVGWFIAARYVKPRRKSPIFKPLDLGPADMERLEKIIRPLEGQ